jgi:hypothetical protein
MGFGSKLDRDKIGTPPATTMTMMTAWYNLTRHGQTDFPLTILFCPDGDWWGRGSLSPLRSRRQPDVVEGVGVETLERVLGRHGQATVILILKSKNILENSTYHVFQR